LDAATKRLGLVYRLKQVLSVAKSSTTEAAKTAEELRLDEAGEKGAPWRQWGPYLSERQWGTVREDYSENGDAWANA
jgi:hypothetical protein